jgi:anti-sigma regulatory factor (Ser/Thr protein kinase)
VRCWLGPDRIVVRVHDTGPGPADPLTGLVPAPGGPAGPGLGLWLIHQLTNIDVALLAAADGFTVRLRAGRLPTAVESRLHSTRALWLGSSDQTRGEL